MRGLLATLLSLFTGVAGHYLNGRLDRALLFLGLLFAWQVAAYLLALYVFRAAGPEAGVLTAWLTRYAMILGAGVAVLLVASAAVTLVDGRRKARMTATPPTVSGWIGMVLTSLMGLGIVAYDGFLVSTYQHASEFLAGTEQPESSSTEQVYKRSPARWFHGSVHYGGRVDFRAEHPQPPGGDGYLVGVVGYEGQPAEGVQLRLILNGEYETELLLTDTQGRFVVRLPPGRWHVNHLQTESWAEKPPEGKFMLLSGHEPKLQEERYEPFVNQFPGGLPVEITEAAPAEPQLSVEIRPVLQMTWPGEFDAKAPANVKEGVIRWEPYPGATSYIVKISEVERQTNSATFQSLVWRRIDAAAQLRLSELATETGDDKEREYAVEVYAFSEDGTFLSRSGPAFDGFNFTLTDGHRIIHEESMSGNGEGPSIEDLEKQFAERRRLEAVVVLIREDMLDAAGRLLAKVEDARPGSCGRGKVGARRRRPCSSRPFRRAAGAASPRNTARTVRELLNARVQGRGVDSAHGATR